MTYLGPKPCPGRIHITKPKQVSTAAKYRLVARLGTPAGRPAGAIVVFVGAPAEPAGRQALLAGLRAELSPAAPLVLVDHNQPRRWCARALAALRLAAGGLPPARARYPAARELVALGFTVECLRLARGERLQLVRARR